MTDPNPYQLRSVTRLEIIDDGGRVLVYAADSEIKVSLHYQDGWQTLKVYVGGRTHSGTSTPGSTG